MIARVFPRRTAATPTDAYSFVGEPPIDIPPGIDKIHISVAFSYDLPRANSLKRVWEHVAPVIIGGPALGQPSGEFTPGLYLKEGFVITSRGCPNRCWFCQVWRREPKLIELPIKEGWIVQDDNLLACSEQHIRNVFAMLKRQKHQAEFRGGLEAKLLKDWHVDLFRDLNPKSMFFAYDTPDDLQYIIKASEMLTPYFTRNKLFCYVLIGYPNDTDEKAICRLQKVKDLGMCPFAMLYRDEQGNMNTAMKSLQRKWCRPAIIYSSHEPRPKEQGMDGERR